jgi:NAD(P)-dependent dehydrogenase (short-subunit alcohol dehydrogenase family)
MSDGTKRAVLVTGASSGIGNAIARHLAERSCWVYGTVRNEKAAAELGAIPNVVPLMLDVTKAEQIQDAVAFVTEQGHSLYGLVNNAGLGDLGMLSTWTDAEMLHIFDVNVFGPSRMTNAFLPLLVESKGRIVNIGSQGGMLAKNYYGPYTMTKHAIEAYTETLRAELEPYGVLASVVQPGGIATNIGAASQAGTIARLQRAQPPFREEAEQILAYFSAPPPPQEDTADDASAAESEANRKPSSPTIVAEAVYDALFSPSPKLHYLVGTKWEGDRVINALLSKLLDENDNPKHNYSREQLVACLTNTSRDGRRANSQPAEAGPVCPAGRIREVMRCETCGARCTESRRAGPRRRNG